MLFRSPHIFPRSIKAADTMNERIHWFSVEGRPFCDAENVWFQKYPDSFGRGLNLLCYIVHVSNPTCYEFKIHFPSVSLPLVFLSLFLFIFHVANN